MKCKCGKGEVVAVRGGDNTKCSRCNRQFRMADYLGELGIPKKFQASTLADFPKFKAVDVSLLLTGPAGTGKTHLAIALLVNDILNTPMGVSLPVAFTSMINLLSRIKATFSKSASETEEDIVSYFCKVPNLYIDDIGVEQATDWALARVYQIIDYRWSNELRTVFTSNFDLNQLAEKMDVRISSRIGGMASVISLTGADRRRK